MVRISLCLSLLAASLVQGDSPQPAKPRAKPLLESWQAVYFEGMKVGHLHFVAQQTGMGDTLRIRSSRTMNLVIKRYGSVLPVQIEQTSEETPAGKVLALGLSQQLGNSPKMMFAGTVEDGHLLLRVNEEDAVRKIPFDGKASGLYAQEMLFQSKKVKPGDKLTINSYEVVLPGPLNVQVQVKNMEKVDRMEVTRTAEGKVVAQPKPASLLRIEAVPDAINIAGNEIRLPGKVAWLGANFLPVREQFEMPGLGVLTVYTTTKEVALQEGVAPDRLPDLGLNINIPLRQTIENPYRANEAFYRITMKDKLDKVFPEDDRQKIGEKKDQELELLVRAQREPGSEENAALPGPEFLEGNSFIDSDDARIKALAKAITRNINDPWKKAQALEKWVHDSMKVSTAVGFPSASRIARDLEGDCRQHALLLAALARASGIPSRTAVGLIYVREPGRSPHFGFHMWSEVWVRGKWVALDAILGEGSVGATHIKMGDHSWAKTQTLAPLLPIAQTLGKLQIEVLAVK
ncbi:MAG: transglutaminase-like domain-containing protein [Gemmataceae bacterium]